MSRAPTLKSDGTYSEEFWQGVHQAQDLLRQGKSWSGHERNCCFLNTGGERFANVSALSGLDFLDDGRGLGIVDWDHDGDLDLWTTNRTSPRVRFLRNEFPTEHHYLALQLQGNGTSTNRDAIGARVELHPGNVIKTLRAGEGFLAQSTKWVHFGLGDSTHVDRVVVRWPDGTAQEFTGLEADRRYRLIQGQQQARPWRIAPREVALEPSSLQPAELSAHGRSLLPSLLPLPRLDYRTFNESPANTADLAGHPVLLNLWASWCAPCVKELTQFAKRADELESAGVTLLAVSVDGVGDDRSNPAAAQSILKQLQFPFPAGLATDTLLDKLQLVHDELFFRTRPLPLPASFLIDARGRLAVLYKGPLDVDTLVADVQRLELQPADRRHAAVPFAGRFIWPQQGHQLIQLADRLRENGHLLDATEYLRRNAPQLAHQLPEYARATHDLALEFSQQDMAEQALKTYRELLRVQPEHAAAHRAIAAALVTAEQFEEAAAHYHWLVKFEPENADAQFKLGTLLERQGNRRAAVPCFRAAARLQPELARVQLRLATVLEAERLPEEAIDQYRTALVLDPQLALAHAGLARTLQQQDRLAEAEEHWRALVALRPDSAPAQLRHGENLYQQGMAEEALVAFRRAIELDPEDATAKNDAAWILATHTDALVRDGELAVRWAEDAARATDHQQIGVLDTLAAAYAEAGRFEDAIATTGVASKLARQANMQEQIERIQLRLRLYQDHQPCRAQAGATQAKRPTSE